MSDTRLPLPESRTCVAGSTGSGKTRWAFWLASTRNFDVRPMFIIDFKGEELFEALEHVGAKEISVHSRPPKEPGIYIVRPMPHEEDAVTAFLWQLHARADGRMKNGCIVYIDEIYMIGARNDAFNALLTQGRSKKIEMINCTQRPRWCSRFIFSESTFFAVLNLNLEDDRDHVRVFLGGKKNGPTIDLLQDYHSLYYDVQRQRSIIMSPVPRDEQLLGTFHQRLKKGRASAI